MRNILILGAGKSSIALIDYLVEHAAAEQFKITVGDLSAELALQKTKGRDNTIPVGIDLKNDAQRKAMIEDADIVISMLPAALHLTIAKDCLELGKDLVTPSYISEAMGKLDAAVKSKGLIFMNEMGLDPGIDHMSAMQILDRLRNEGCTITGFESHCGGLVAPDSDTNPWHYKFSWNPRNVILAGQGEGKIRYKKNGELVELGYEELFTSTTEIEIEGYGNFESYPNRDSLKYMEAYGLENVDTMYRGTLRIPPFCEGWSQLVQYGFTDDKEVLNDMDGYTYSDFFETKMGIDFKHLPTGLRSLFRNLVSDTGAIPLKQGTRAQILQALLEEKWKMQPDDTDMVVMVHVISYLQNGEAKNLQSSLVQVGRDAEHTAMAITVGLPVAVVTKMILNGRINQRGVLLPRYAEIYNPVLQELKEYGIGFEEREI
jgi:saccharopine dehydrogenase-like NADP-dependent oxidoreductase